MQAAIAIVKAFQAPTPNSSEESILVKLRTPREPNRETGERQQDSSAQHQTQKIRAAGSQSSANANLIGPLPTE
jgi:hypothetical protein